ncbi:MAG: DNA-directed RNA polymerase subunit omega [Burkholderiales bacterium]
MARVTVEDCVEVVKNRFELVVLASQRSKDIASGSPLTVERDNDKNPVVALREIAERKINVNNLREVVIQSSQRRVKADVLEELPEEGADATEIMNEMQTLNVEQELSNGMSFEDDNLDLED